MSQEMEHCQQQLKEKGYKFTNQRKTIIEIFLSSQKHLLTAAQIYDETRQKNLPLNYSTVYRNLETLLECGLVKRVSLQDGTASYEYNRHQHHHHLICLKCHDAEMIDYCPYEDINRYIQEHTTFYPVEHRFEIYGYCEKCRKNMTRD